MENKKLAIRGCSELKEYFQYNGVRNLSGNNQKCVYFEDSDGSYGWDCLDTYFQNIDECEVVSFEEYFKRKKTKNLPPNIKNLSITKTQSVQIGEKKREITITVLSDLGKVRAGYSVRNPEDKKSNPELAKQISTGRAMSDKTNMVDMNLGRNMDKKYILYAIAEQLFREIESGKIQIKGVK